MRRHRAISVALSSLGVVAGLSFSRAQAAPETLRLAGPPTEDAVNASYAEKSGMFARADLDVEMIATASGTAATTAVIAGTYELARTSMMAVFTAHLRNIPIVVVAPHNLYSTQNPFSLLQIAADSPYKTGADLSGKTIGSPALNDLNVLATRAWVDKNGGDWRSLKFVEIPNAALEASIVAHRIDAAILQLTQLDDSLAAGTTKTLGNPLAAIAPVFLAGVNVARGEWATPHAESLRKLNRVLIDSGAYVNAHHAETVPLVVELTKMDPANVTKMRRTIFAPSLDIAMVQPVIDAAARYGIIPRGFSARELLWSDR